MTLVDTSVWIATFRAKNPLRLEDHVDLEQVVTCLPIIQEGLQGFRDEVAYRKARSGFLALPIVETPLELSLFEEAVQLYRTARRHGLTVRSSVDCLIAACALRHGLSVLHRDRDYTHLAKVSALQQSEV